LTDHKRLLFNVSFLPSFRSIMPLPVPPERATSVRPRDHAMSVPKMRARQDLSVQSTFETTPERTCVIVWIVKAKSPLSVFSPSFPRQKLRLADMAISVCDRVLVDRGAPPVSWRSGALDTQDHRCSNPRRDETQPTARPPTICGSSRKLRTGQGSPCRAAPLSVFLCVRPVLAAAIWLAKVQMKNTGPPPRRGCGGGTALHLSPTQPTVPLSLNWHYCGLEKICQTA